MSEQKITGIDLAKTNFYLFSINAHGKPARKIKLSRNQLLYWLAQQPKMTVAMEACGASHHWAWETRKLGHDVILLPAQHVKAYQRRQKNDYNDAQAIAEACQHGTIRPVPIKTLEQQDVQTFLKMHRLVSMERTQLINHVRGLIAEYGIVFSKGATELHQKLPALLEDAENELTDTIYAMTYRKCVPDQRPFPGQNTRRYGVVAPAHKANTPGQPQVNIVVVFILLPRLPPYGFQCVKRYRYSVVGSRATAALCHLPATMDNQRRSSHPLSSFRKIVCKR
jgi:hypothetical protein